MTNDIAKVLGLADKITTKAEGSLSALEHEMAIMKWPADFRAILWETVADIATRRAVAARNS